MHVIRRLHGWLLHTRTIYRIGADLLWSSAECLHSFKGVLLLRVYLYADSRSKRSERNEMTFELMHIRYRAFLRSNAMTFKS